MIESPELLLILAAVCESEYWSVAELIVWADRQIMSEEQHPAWLLDLCLAKTKEDCSRTLIGKWGRSTETTEPPWPDFTIFDDFRLGFLFLRWERGDLSLISLLVITVDSTDDRGSRIPCEAFYSLLREIDGAGQYTPSNRPLRERVEELFEPVATQAREFLENAEDLYDLRVARAENGNTPSIILAEVKRQLGLD